MISSFADALSPMMNRSRAKSSNEPCVVPFSNPRDADAGACIPAALGTPHWHGARAPTEHLTVVTGLSKDEMLSYERDWLRFIESLQMEMGLLMLGDASVRTMVERAPRRGGRLRYGVAG